MRRLLVVGAEIPNLPSISWQEWPSASPLDYQGLLLDCRKPLKITSQHSVAEALRTLAENSHTAYIILPGAEAVPDLSGPMMIVPTYELFVQTATGQTLNLRSDDAFFQGYAQVLLGHEIFFQLQLPHNRAGWPVLEGIVDNVSRAICARVGAGIYLLHPPPKKNEQKAFKVILENFKPDPLPVSNFARPAWVDEAAAILPGVALLQTARASIADEIRKKSDLLKSEEEKLIGLSGWADILWLEGLPLQNKVSEALGLLGVRCIATDPSGHAADLTANESGVHFVFEVTGSSGTIGIEKGRQLMQWIAESADPAGTKGVLVANAFRNDRPDKRPPSQDKRIFVSELERLGTKYHLALLDVRELYRVLCLKLAGQAIDKSAIVSGLTSDGVVEFQIS